jgi:hypothetical protein
MSIAEQLMSCVADPVATSGAKVTLVGVGQVGMAAAFSILQQVNQTQFKIIITNFEKSVSIFAHFKYNHIR